MSAPSTDFLKFNAYQIKDLIIRKLSEDTKFTDQVYEGSNLNTLIDLVSYMFQVMMYSLNNAAAESMFADTMLYENISRLCRFIGYNPKGMSPPGTRFYLNTTQEDHKHAVGTIIPRYSRIDSKKTDSLGRKVYYSTIEDITVQSDTLFPVPMYNGTWKLHDTVFEANGGEYQTYTLTGVKSDSAEGRYVANDYIHVYVLHGGTMTRWVMDKDEIFLNTSMRNVGDSDFGSIYKTTDPMYTVRLNENKEYEIKFGNGILGKIPEDGDRIYVFYLEGNGPEGVLTPDDASLLDLEHSHTMFEISQELYEDIFQTTNTIFGDDPDAPKTIKLGLYTNSTKSVPEEDVETIRETAPYYFKYGNRLITRNDYEYFIKRNYPNDIIDVKCQNNLEYGTSFLKWLYYYGKSGLIRRMTNTGDARYYLKSNRLKRYDYKYADPADSDNIYLWCKVQSDINNQEVFLRNLQSSIAQRASDMKTLTQEISLLRAIDVWFTPCAAFDEYALSKYILGDSNFKETEDTFIEITLEDNSIYVNAAIQSAVAKIILKYFDYQNCHLGQKVDYNTILGDILSLNGVQRVRTIFRDDSTNEEIIKNGLSFATWSDRYLDPGDDLQVSNSMRLLEPFQFPKFHLTEQELVGKIKIIRRSLSNTSTIKY